MISREFENRFSTEGPVTRFLSILVVVLLAACSSTTEPNAIDSRILVTSLSDDVGPVIWASDSGSDTVRVAPCATHLCTS
jgi:hypothetical protein